MPGLVPSSPRGCATPRECAGWVGVEKSDDSLQSERLQLNASSLQLSKASAFLSAGEEPGRVESDPVRVTKRSEESFPEFGLNPSTLQVL